MGHRSNDNDDRLLLAHFKFVSRSSRNNFSELEVKNCNMVVSVRDGEGLETGFSWRELHVHIQQRSNSMNLTTTRGISVCPKVEYLQNL